MAEIVYDEAPGISGIAFASGTTGQRREGRLDRQSRGARREGDRRRHRLVRPAVLPGRDRHAGRRPRQGRRRRLLHVRRQLRHATAGRAPTAAAPRRTSTRAREPTPSQTVGTIAAMSVAAGSICSGPSRGAARPPTSQSTCTSSRAARRRSRSPPTPTTSSPGCRASSRSISNSGGSAITVGIAIRRVAGTGAPFLKYIALRRHRPRSSSSRRTRARSPRTRRRRTARSRSPRRPTATPTTPETFSSRGPVTHLFDVNGAALAQPDVRQKPNLASADGVSTSVGARASRRSTARAPPPRPRPASRR